MVSNAASDTIQIKLLSVQNSSTMSAPFPKARVLSRTTRLQNVYQFAFTSRMALGVGMVLRANIPMFAWAPRKACVVILLFLASAATASIVFISTFENVPTLQPQELALLKGVGCLTSFELSIRNLSPRRLRSTTWIWTALAHPRRRKIIYL